MNKDVLSLVFGWYSPCCCVTNIDQNMENTHERRKIRVTVRKRNYEANEIKYEVSMRKVVESC